VPVTLKVNRRLNIPIFASPINLAQFVDLHLEQKLLTLLILFDTNSTE